VWRAAIWAAIVALTGDICFLGIMKLVDAFPTPRFLLPIAEVLAYFGLILLTPGVVMEKLLSESISEFWFVPAFSFAVYFILFFFFFRWRARRKAARESAAAQGTSPNVA
jgi:hypothetical protein